MGERVGDIDSCYREVIMVVCQVNQEQELQNAQFVQKTLGRLKTRMADLVARLSYRNIAQKRVGLFAQQALSNVIIVEKKLKPLVAKINNIVIWSAETKAISIKQASKLELGRAIKRLTLLYISGLRHIIRSLMFVNIAKRKAIQNGPTYHRNIIENVMTGSTYVSRVTSNLMGKTIKTLEGTNNVIRKRYAKYKDPDNWEATWETMTPAIN